MKNPKKIIVKQTATFEIKKGLAQMLKGGVIMDVVNVEHAKIAEEAGACAVMALERVPSDIRVAGGVARMSDPEMILKIMDAVSIPVMAKCRIGHFVEAQVLQALGVDYIDESEVLTPADEDAHVDKHPFAVPFVCGCRNLGEALRRINEGAAMIRTKGEAGTGNIVEAVRHKKTVTGEITALQQMSKKQRTEKAEEYRVPVALVEEVAKLGRLPVVNFAAGGIATPADAALMMQLGSDGVFVGSGIFKSSDPLKRAKAIVAATTQYQNPEIIAEVSKGLGEAMQSIDIRTLPEEQLLAKKRMVNDITIGVLALQGDFLEHRTAFDKLGISTKEVRLPQDLATIDGIIIPGGESTTIAYLLDLFGLREPLVTAVKNGLPVWGTCAGMILLAKKLVQTKPKPLGLMDITVDRNAFGRQIESFTQPLSITAIGEKPLHATFIRAPKIVAAEPSATILSTLVDGTIVAAQQENMLATSFHPELTKDLRLHEYFVSLVTNKR